MVAFSNRKGIPEEKKPFHLLAILSRDVDVTSFVLVFMDNLLISMPHAWKIQGSLF